MAHLKKKKSLPAFKDTGQVSPPPPSPYCQFALALTWAVVHSMDLRATVF